MRKSCGGCSLQALVEAGAGGGSGAGALGSDDALGAAALAVAATLGSGVGLVEADGDADAVGGVPGGTVEAAAQATSPASIIRERARTRIWRHPTQAQRDRPSLGRRAPLGSERIHGTPRISRACTPVARGP